MGTDVLGGVDLLDPDTFTEGVPHGLFDALLEHGIARAYSPSKQIDFWVVTRHEDVNAVSRNHALFSSQRMGTILGYPEAAVQEIPALTHVDPPRHDFLRRLVQGWFTPRALAGLRDQIRATCRGAIGQLLSEGGGDFADDVAGAVPAQAIGSILGVPPSDREQVARWGLLMNSEEDPEFALEIAEQDPFKALCAYAHELAALRRRDPADDLTTHLLSAQVEGQRLDIREFETMIALIVNAGTGTTKDAVCSALVTLLDHPSQAQAVRDEPAWMPSAVEEVLRWTTPVLYFARTAIEDTKIEDQEIGVGEQVALYFAGANFDPTVFRDPRRFDVARDPNPHTTFGGTGRHLCLGAHLARLELQVMLEELLPHLTRMELAGTPERLRSHINSGYKRVEITFGP